MQRIFIALLFALTFFVAGLIMGQFFEQKNVAVASDKKSQIVYTLDNCLAELDESQEKI